MIIIIVFFLQILALRKQIETLQNQISDTGGGSSGNTASGGANSGRTSKTVSLFSYCFFFKEYKQNIKKKIAMLKDC